VPALQPGRAGQGHDGPEKQGLQQLRVVHRTEVAQVLRLRELAQALVKKFAVEWHALKRDLRSLGYDIKYKLVNTKDHGIPHSRPRTYLVGVRRDIKVMKFRFPRPIPEEPIDRFLDNDDGMTSSCLARVRLHLSKHVNGVLKRAYRILKKKGADPAADPCFVDTGASLKWSSVMVGRSPCLTATRCASGGHFMTHRGRLMTISEMCRLQGLPPDRINYMKANISPKKFATAIGNMMSVNVLQRILPPLLNSAGLDVKGHFKEVPSLFSHRLRGKTCDEDTDIDFDVDANRMEVA